MHQVIYSAQSSDRYYVVLKQEKSLASNWGCVIGLASAIGFSSIGFALAFDKVVPTLGLVGRIPQLCITLLNLIITTRIESNALAGARFAAFIN